MRARSVGFYEIGKRIGHGTYGECHAAIDRRNNRLYCLKIIENAGNLDEREARVLGSLDHPGIVQYHDSFVAEDAFCLVMKFCDGGDLASVIRQRARSGEFFSEDAILDMFVQLVHSLQYLHGQRILHRDLKPANILLASSPGAGEPPHLLLADFGIAKVLEAANSAAATVLGTPTYLAPEICRGQSYSYPADVWALGCILHEMISLKPAWATTNLLAAVYKICEKQPPPLPHCPGMYSYDLQCLVDEMLSKDPAQRPTLDEISRRPIVRAAADRAAAQHRFASPSATGTSPSDVEVDAGRTGGGDEEAGLQVRSERVEIRRADGCDSDGGDSGGGDSDGDGQQYGRSPEHRCRRRALGRQSVQQSAVRPGKSMGGLLRRFVPRGHLPMSLSPGNLPQHAPAAHSAKGAGAEACRMADGPVVRPPPQPAPASCNHIEHEAPVVPDTATQPPLDVLAADVPPLGTNGAEASAWFYRSADNEEEGPFDEEMLMLMHALGDLADETVVWNPHLNVWSPLHVIAKSRLWTDDSEANH